MRGATECARRLKLFLSSLRSTLGKVGQPSAGDPITQMLLGILSRNTPESKAREGLDRLRAVVVDYNELRVIPPFELTDTLGDFPDARLKCEDISRSLNAVFALEHTVSLDRLTELSKKDARAYLDEIDGLEAYTVARIRLLGLGQHAIPLDEAMWALARREEIVHAGCSLVEAQQFLERRVAEENAFEFVALLKKHAWSEMSAAVKRGTVERIFSVPPDRTARNMLQMVSCGAALLGDAELVEEPPPPDEPAEVRKPSRRRAPASKGDAKPTTAPPKPQPEVESTEKHAKAKAKPKAKRGTKTGAKSAGSRGGAAGASAKAKTGTRKTARKPTATARRQTKSAGRSRSRKSAARAKLA